MSEYYPTQVFDKKEEQRIEQMRRWLESLVDSKVVITHTKQDETHTTAGVLAFVGNKICRLNGAVDYDKFDPDLVEDAIDNSFDTPSIPIKFILKAYEL